MVDCAYDILEYALKVSKIKYFAVITVNTSSPSPGLFHYILQAHRLKTISESLPLFVYGNKFKIPKKSDYFYDFCVTYLFKYNSYSSESTLSSINMGTPVTQL